MHPNPSSPPDAGVPSTVKILINPSRTLKHLLSETKASMKVTQEKLPASQVGLEIEISPEMSKKAYEKVVQDLSRTANIPGFRKGKVPRHILLQRLGNTRIKAAALEELIQNGLEEAMKQESIEALGNYQLLSSFEELISQFQPGQPLTYRASVDVEPEIHLGEYKEIQVQAEEVKPKPEQVDEVLEERRRELATLIPVEGRAAQSGDVAVVDYSARFADAGEEDAGIPGAQATDFQVELTEGKFIPGFIDGIVGMNVGETKELAVEFPSDYSREDLAGRPTLFTVTLQDLKEKELPELDDDFAQEVSEFQTLAELRESIEKKYQQQAERQTKENKEQALLDALVNYVEMEAPETLIARETDYMLRQAAIQLKQYGLDVNQLYNQDSLPQIREQSRPDAVNRIKQTLGLKEIAKRESIQATDTELDAKIEEVMAELGQEALDPLKVRSYVEEQLVREKTLQWLEENTTIELVPEGSLAKKDDSETETEGAEEATPVEVEVVSE